MTTPNNENSFPEPDPAWDYYLTYHKLRKANSELEKLISYVREYDEALSDLDKEINEELSAIIKLLESSHIQPN